MNDRLQPGMIAWADVRNPFENPGCGGKLRPCVVVERRGGHVLIIGMTTDTHFRSGLPRVAVPGQSRLGLARRDGYLWADHLTRVSALDVDDPVGWITPELADVVDEHVTVTSAQIEALRQAAAAHHLPLDRAA